MTVAIGKFATKTEREIHDDYLRTVRNGLIQQGVTNPQLGPNSDEDNYATALAREIVPINANTVLVGDAQMPDTAAGDPVTGQNVGADLVRQMAIYGLAPRGAVPSSGYITLTTSASTNITGRDGGAPGSGQQLLDAAGLRYEVSTSGIYANGALVPIIAIDAGANTNHAAGDVLQWGTAPTYCAQKQSVATGGLTGGSDAEDTETARTRLLDRLRNPPGSGNWSQIAGYAEASTPLVQKAFVYPAVNGPSTVHVAVTSSDATRVIDATVLANVVTPYVAGKIFGGVELVVTAVTEQDTEIAVGLTLPAAPTASPAGPGGGWVDGTPWPSLSANTYCQVTAVTSSTQFTVDAETAPTDNVSHICMWDETAVNADGTIGKLLRAKVISHSGTAGAYVITIDTPFPNATANNVLIGPHGTFIFPDATNMDTYARALASAMLGMGPGEKTSNVSVLTRGYRHPTPQTAWPSSMNASQLKAVEDTGSEVLDTSYYFRSVTTPGIPAAVSDPPKQLVLRRLGFYPIN